MAYRFNWLTHWDVLGASAGRAPVRAAAPSAQARAAWIRRCAGRLSELRPDAPPAQAAIAATQLWENARDMDPHAAAALRSVSWIAHETV